MPFIKEELHQRVLFFYESTLDKNSDTLLKAAEHRVVLPGETDS